MEKAYPRAIEGAFLSPRDCVRPHEGIFHQKKHFWDGSASRPSLIVIRFQIKERSVNEANLYLARKLLNKPKFSRPVSYFPVCYLTFWQIVTLISFEVSFLTFFFFFFLLVTQQGILKGHKIL